MTKVDHDRLKYRRKKMAKVIFQAKKGTSYSLFFFFFFFFFLNDVCKPGRGQLVGEIIL